MPQQMTEKAHHEYLKVALCCELFVLIAPVGPMPVELLPIESVTDQKTCSVNRGIGL